MQIVVDLFFLSLIFHNYVFLLSTNISNIGLPILYFPGNYPMLIADYLILSIIGLSL